MSATFGINIRVTIFGESHGEGIGVLLDGLPPGLLLDMERITAEMERRAPGRDVTSTARKELDTVEIKSGLYKGSVTGVPLLAWIKNSEKRSADYSALEGKLRPSHADYTANIKYRGYSDPRGGGHFSGRLTAGLVFAGAVAKQYLFEKGIHIGAKIDRIYTAEDIGWQEEALTRERFSELSKMRIPTLDACVGEAMSELIKQAKAEGDSLGGVLSALAFGVPAGLGEPFFHSFESALSHLLFSIPAVKGVEFGAGFGFAALKGSEANDPFLISKSGEIYTKTNLSGGINGGITNGMPILVRIAARPTPSIAKAQETVDLQAGEACKLEIFGRHDPCILPRMVPVAEAALAITIFDLLMEADKWKSF